MKMLNMIILICLLPRSKHFCQKSTNTLPRPVAKQNCHFEPKKVDEMQRRTREHKAKRYSYSQDCKAVPREVTFRRCATRRRRSLSCPPAPRLVECC